MGMVLGIALMWFVIEMLLWVLIAQFVSGWYVFFWFIIAAVIGLKMIKHTSTVLNPMAQQMKSGVITSSIPNERTISKAVSTGLAGLLLVIPGVLSDGLALILLLPFVQKLLARKAKAYALNNQEKMMALMAKQMGGMGNPFGVMGGFGGKAAVKNHKPFGATTIDGTAKVKNNQPPANDD